jgi:hypothetical protein
MSGLCTYPSELLMASNKVQIRTICCKPLAVIVKTVNLLIWQRDATERISPAIVSIFVFIDVVTKMNNIIDRVLCEASQYVLSS